MHIKLKITLKYSEDMLKQHIWVQNKPIPWRAMFSTTWIQLNSNNVDKYTTFSCTGQASNEGDNFIPQDISTTRVTSTN